MALWTEPQMEPTLSLQFWAKCLNPGKEPSSINGESCILDFDWWVLEGKHENGRSTLEIVNIFWRMDQLNYWTIKVGPWHVLTASFSCFSMMFQHSKIEEIWAPNSRAFHAVGGPFTQWEVLFADFHGNSRVFCAHPGFGAESTGVKNVKQIYVYVSVMFRSLLSILCKIHLCFSMFLLCFAACSHFLCFMFCFLLCFAACSLFYVLRFVLS